MTTAEDLLLAIDGMPTKPDWDSYGACPITEAAKSSARRIVKALGFEVGMVPTNDGGIEFEFDENGSSALVLRVRLDGTLQVEFTDY